MVYFLAFISWNIFFLSSFEILFLAATLSPRQSSENNNIKTHWPMVQYNNKISHHGRRDNMSVHRIQYSSIWQKQHMNLVSPTRNFTTNNVCIRYRPVVGGNSEWDGYYLGEHASHQPVRQMESIYIETYWMNVYLDSRLPSQLMRYSLLKNKLYWWQPTTSPMDRSTAYCIVIH